MSALYRSSLSFRSSRCPAPVGDVLVDLEHRDHRVGLVALDDPVAGDDQRRAVATSVRQLPEPLPRPQELALDVRRADWGIAS